MVFLEEVSVMTRQVPWWIVSVIIQMNWPEPWRRLRPVRPSPRSDDCRNRLPTSEKR